MTDPAATPPLSRRPPGSGPPSPTAADAAPVEAVDAEAPAPRTGSSPSGPGDGALRTLVSIGANVSVLTALLVYFGWKRSDTQARILGLDESVLGLSTRDYVLRSVGSLFVPLAVVAAAGLAWLSAHRYAMALLARSDGVPALRRVARALALAWLWLPAAAAASGLVSRWAAYLAFPLSFGVGTLLSCYGVWLGRLVATAAGRQPPAIPPWQASLTRLFVTIMVLLSAFWAISNYADVLGVNLARRMSNRLDSLTEVVVYSDRRLHIDAPGTREDDLGGEESSAYRYRYSGLRLLQHTGGRFFVVSDDWTPTYGVVMVLDDDDTVRLEFVRDQRIKTAD